MRDAELFGVLHRIKTKQWGNGRRGVLVMMCEEGGKSTNIWHDSGGRERLSKLSTRGTATNTMKIQREREIGLAGGAVMKTIPHEPLVTLFSSLLILL